MSAVLPVAAALAGALVYGVTGVLQQRAARRVPTTSRNQLRLLWGLAGQPSWLLSTVGSVAGFALQGLALGTGPITLVQPLLVTGLLFAAVTAFLLARRPIDWPLMGGLVLTAAGLAAFLLAARPDPGTDALTPGDVLPLAATLAVLLAGCLTLAARSRGLARSLALAFAAGILYGVSAAIAKVTIDAFAAGGAAGGLTSWSLWALVVVGPLGFVLNQNAFREGALVSPTLAVITVTDPLVAIGIGLLWLDEHVAGSAGALVGEVLGLAAMVGGVWLVAHRAPHVADEQHRTHRPGAGRGLRHPERAVTGPG